LRGHEHVIECVKFGVKAGVDKGSQNVATADGNLQNSTAENQPSQMDYLLVSGSRDRTVRVWDALRGICLLNFTTHENWVRGVLFDPTSRYVISCSDDKTIRVFDIKEDRCIRTIEEAHGHFVSCLAASKVRSIYFTGSVDKTISLWSC
jgi:platelet-activating factor acetylhydrolase IB subunit alpha